MSEALVGTWKLVSWQVVIDGEAEICLEHIQKASYC